MVTILMLWVVGLVLALCTLGLGTIIIAAERAPEGHEDAEGFHFGVERWSLSADFLASLLAEGRDDVRDAGLPETQTQRERAGVAWSPLGVRERGGRATVS
jgi:hypothetical protein